VPARVLDFHDMKGDLESLAALAGVRLDYRGSNATFAHPGRSAGVYRDDTCIGWIGQIHPRLQRVMDVDTEMFGFELDMGLLLAREVPRAGSMSKFPSVRRDLAFVVPESVSWAAMQATARQAAGQSMREVRLFDRYAGKGVETGFKSLAMGLILQDESRTLTDRDVEATVTQVVAALEQEHGAAIRR
jgi:phenylalanyl-tRNA synthetase beta chain